MNNTYNTTKNEFEFKNGLFTGSNTEQIYPKLKAVAHPLRLQILYLISQKETCVQELVKKLGTTQSNVSQHLRLLRDNKIVVATRVDNYSFYRIICPATLQIVGTKEGKIENLPNVKKLNY